MATITSDMLRFLALIEERPEMYLGGSSDERGEQLRNLGWVLLGYQRALADHVHDTRDDFLGAFAAFLVSDYRCSAARGPIAAIRDMARDDADAWCLLWECVRRFAASVAGGSGEPDRGV